MFCSTRRPTAAARRPRNTSRRAFLAGVEGMETRQLMTVVPTFATVDLTQHNWQYTQIAPTQFAPMEDTNVVGLMPATVVSGGQTVYGDNFKVYLNAGQIEDINLDVQTTVNSCRPLPAAPSRGSWPTTIRRSTCTTPTTSRSPALPTPGTTATSSSRPIRPAGTTSASTPTARSPG